MYFVTLSLQFYYHIILLDETMEYAHVLPYRKVKGVCIFRCFKYTLHNMFTKQASLFLSAYELHSVHRT